ncbi:hypothetical protein [Methylobacterium oryzae]|uniref:hypothetical protein n=1 Tax=Methylobacterium oryzae TaxID=334852 RepID=UPI002F3504F0
MVRSQGFAFAHRVTPFADAFPGSQRLMILMVPMPAYVIDELRPLGYVVGERLPYPPLIGGWVRSRPP